MAKVKFNVKGVESGSDRPLPKPGVYRCKVTTCVDAKPSGKDRRLEVVYTITDGDHKGFPIYDYINLESEAAAWKLRQFLEAVGLVSGKKESGDFDPDELVGTALSVKTKIQAETDNYAASVKASVLMPLDAEEGEKSEDLSDDDGDDDDGEDEQDYSAMDVDELSAEAEERELDVEAIVKGKKSAKAKKAALIEALEENDEEDDDDSDDDDDDSDDDSDDETYSEEELNDLDDDDLVDVAFGYEDDDGDEIEGILDEDEKGEYVKSKGKGKAKKVTVDRDALIARCLEAQGDDDDDDDGDDETPDYESMELPALKKLCKERELNVKGSKKVLIARLQKDDEPF